MLTEDLGLAQGPLSDKGPTRIGQGWSGRRSGCPGQVEASWVAHIRANFGILGAASAFALGYFAATAGRPHRAVVMAITAAVAPGSLSGLIGAPIVARQKWRAAFTLTATVVTGVLFTVCLALDGGLGSPLVYLLGLPIASASATLGPASVAIVSSTSLAELAVVSVTDGTQGRRTSELVFLAFFVVALSAWAISSAANRARLQHSERVAYDEVATMASVDSLTGCMNHGSFYIKLRDEVDRASRTGEALALLMVDVDHFKAFNDSNGHPAGDSALVKVSALIRRQVRASDVVARAGGDEFAVLLPGTGREEATAVAQALRAVVAQGTNPRATVSVGVSSLRPSNSSWQQLLAEADAALYGAKAHGRDQVCPYSGARRSAAPRTGSEPGDRASRTECPPSRRGGTDWSPDDVDAFELATVGMAVVDEQGIFRRVNVSFARLVGRAREKIVGESFSSLTAEADVEANVSIMGSLLSGKAESARFEKRYLLPDGSVVWADLSVKAVIGPSGEVDKLLAEALDITARKAAEEAIAEENRRLEEAQRIAVGR